MRTRDRDTRAGLYEIVCLRSGRRYVGSSRRLLRRFHEHATALRHGRHANRFLQRAWGKHGEAAFAFRILAVLEPDVELLRTHEDRLIAVARAMGNCMNLATTATTGPRHSEATRALISARLRTSASFAAAREGITAKQRGLRRSDAMRMAQSKRMTGRRLDPSTVQKITTANRGQKRTPEQCERISAAKKGKAFTPEHRAALSAARRAYVEATRHG